MSTLRDMNSFVIILTPHKREPIHYITITNSLTHTTFIVYNTIIDNTCIRHIIAP